MTATTTRTDQAVSEWVKVFPRQAAENYTGSVTFMKQLTVVAVSIITYVKNIFPNDDYILENFGGLNLHILKKKCSDEIAQFLSNAMIQAFDAFDKKYLHKFALCFYEDEFKPENLVDYLIFEYSYNDDKVTMNVHSRNQGSSKETTKYTFENVRYRTIKMIRSIMVALSDDNHNPSSYEICLRLYYNEDAPANYQAPGFVDGKESEDHIDPTTQELIPLGSVETPFHKIVTKAFKREQGCTSKEPLPSQSAPVLHSSNETNFTEGARSDSEIDIQLSCICKRYDGDDLIYANELLTCQYCNTQQHAVCYGVLREHTPYIQHCCHVCYMNDDKRTPTDKKIASADSTKQESFAMFRRVVEFCTQIPAINAQTLVETMRITKINAEKLMMLLHLHGIVRNKPNIDNTLQDIIIEKVQDLRPRLFNTPEVTLSQDSASVTDILSPFKNVSLQRKSSRVSQKQDDPMLKQYRDALQTTDNIEEPETNIVESVKKSVKRKLSRDKSRRSGIQTKKIKSLPK